MVVFINLMNNENNNSCIKKYWYFLNKYIHRGVNKWYLCKNTIISCDIIEQNIDIFNKFDSLSANTNISLEFIEKNIHKEWNFNNLSSNPNINFNLVKNNKNIKWNWDSISKHDSVSWDNIIKNLDLPWNWKYISQNKNITWEIIKNNLDKNWFWYELSKHPNINFDIILSNLNYEWDWTEVSKNPNLKTEIIKSNLNLPWCWNTLSYNKNLDLELFASFEKMYIVSGIINRNDLTNELFLKGLRKKIWIDLEFDFPFEELYESKLLNLKIVKRFKSYQWCSCSLQSNCNFTIDIILNNPKIFSDGVVSNFYTENNNFRFEDVINYPDINWNWETLTIHKKITWKNIEDNIHLPWNWTKILLNPNLTFEFVDKYNDKIMDWSYLSKNEFNFEKQMFNL